MRILFKRAFLVPLLLVWATLSLLADVPEQFRVWGTAGPELKPVPEGWREVRKESNLPRLQPTTGEQARGFVLFAREPLLFETVAVPFAAERASEICCFATLGEFEPLVVGLYALRDLAGLEVRSSELRSRERGVIPAENLDVRTARSVAVIVDASAKTYRREPFLLERRQALSLRKGECGWVWLTLKVPSDAKGGQYTGGISFVAEGRLAAELGISLRVLPFSLPELPCETTLYYPRPAESDEMLTKELVDFREHGASIPIPAMEVRIRSRDRKFGPDDVEETKQYCERLLGGIRKVYGDWRFPATFEVGHQIAFYWDSAKGWFSYWPHSREIEADLGTSIDLMRDIAKANGVPELRAYLSDEGGAHNLLDETIYYNAWVKRHFPQIATTATIGGGIALGFDEVGQLGEAVDFLSANRFTPDIARALAARNQPFGLYNGAGGTPAGARFFFGFYAFKTGARQIGQWSYSFGESPFTGNGLRLDDEGYVYHAADGPLPSTFWEAVREGIDDARYLELLWRMAQAGERSSQGDTRAAAAHARQTLTGILGSIGWGFQAIQSGDRTPPPHPATLRKWRWRVAQEILALGKEAGLVAAPRDANRSSAMAWPWATAREEEVSFGPELLPPSNFENGMGPWRFEAWTGNGKGELDATEHHGGEKAARITVPPADGNKAVTVLVWPQYGEGNLNLALAGGRTYELSAWSKWHDRATPPELRINVPANVLEATRTGHEPANPDGWQRLWVRVTLKSTANPTYLAAWVQGPGTVWLDDLSLREATASPLAASLDQEDYDSLDRIGTASLTVAPQTQVAAIRCELLPAKGDAIAALTVASSAADQPASDREGLVYVPCKDKSCRFVFSPAALKPGRYQVKLELLDAQKRAFASKVLVFARRGDGAGNETDRP